MEFLAGCERLFVWIDKASELVAQIGKKSIKTRGLPASFLDSGHIVRRVNVGSRE
jgi:hypothetical protein